MPVGCSGFDALREPRPIQSFSCISVYDTENDGPCDDMEHVYHRQAEIKYKEHIGRQRDPVDKLVRVVNVLDDTEQNCE